MINGICYGVVDAVWKGEKDRGCGSPAEMKGGQLSNWIFGNYVLEMPVVQSPHVFGAGCHRGKRKRGGGGRKRGGSQYPTEPIAKLKRKAYKNVETDQKKALGLRRRVRLARLAQIVHSLPGRATVSVTLGGGGDREKKEGGHRLSAAHVREKGKKGSAAIRKLRFVERHDGRWAGAGEKGPWQDSEVNAICEKATVLQDTGRLYWHDRTARCRRPDRTSCY